MSEQIKELIKGHLESLTLDEQVQYLNDLKVSIHELSPFKNEPVDCVLWVKHTNVQANQYNPNAVAPPEMELLRQSISSDGYTQPIVSYPKDETLFEVVDGFHRSRVGKECDDIKKRIHGYLPIVKINPTQEGLGDRMASTIRHNRARGTHNIELMSSIVAELVEMGKGDAWICKHIGMSADELLRLKQVTGLASLFANRDFSASWEVEAE
jgi:ParB-like chromosome segregation protein Spo0J